MGRCCFKYVYTWIFQICSKFLSKLVVVFCWVNFRTHVYTQDPQDPGTAPKGSLVGKNPKQPPGMVLKPCKWEKLPVPQLVNAWISEPSTVARWLGK